MKSFCYIILLLLHNLWSFDASEHSLPETAADEAADHYNIISMANGSHSLERIMRLPIRQYEFKYDNAPGRRHTGFLGAEIVSIFPECVDRVPYVFPQRDKKRPPITIPDYPLVDKAAIFMHGIAAVQHAQVLYESLDIQFQDFFDNIFKTFMESLQIRTSDQFDHTGNGTQWLTSAELRALKRAAEAKIKTAEIRLDIARNASELRKRLMAQRIAERKRIRVEQHEQLEGSIRILQNVTTKYQVDALDGAHMFSQQSQDLDLLEEERVIVLEYNETIASLQQEITLVDELAEFKFAEQLKMEAQNEDVVLNIMRARDAVLREGFENAFKTFLSESSAYISDVLARPLVYLMYALIALAVVSVCLFVQELGTVFKAYATGKLTAVPKYRTEWPSRRVQDYFQGLSLDSHTKSSLREYSDCLRESVKRRFPLQSVIIHGVSGTGKTVLAEAIAKSSGTPFMYISAADLQAKGAKASAVLRQVMLQLVKTGIQWTFLSFPMGRPRPAVLIIDGADDMISRQIKIKPTSSTSSADAGAALPPGVRVQQEAPITVTVQQSAATRGRGSRRTVAAVKESTAARKTPTETAAAATATAKRVVTAKPRAARSRSRGRHGGGRPTRDDENIMRSARSEETLDTDFEIRSEGISSSSGDGDDDLSSVPGQPANVTALMSNNNAVTAANNNNNHHISRSNTGSKGVTMIHSCFYILLEAIRYSCPNLSLIITTSSSVRDIDTAILDRVDRIIEVPLPAARERAHFIATKIDEQLGRFLNAEEKSTLQDLLGQNQGSNGDSCGASVDYYSSTPPCNFSVKDDEAAAGLYSAKYDGEEARQYFDMQTCVETAVAFTEGWAYRDIGRIVVNVRSEVLGSTSCRVSTFIWMRELRRKISEKENL